MIFRLYNPPVFQGNLNKKHYFEGWYFKHVSAGLDHVISVIPGISLNDNDPHSFIQIINGANGDSEYVSYPVSDFSWDRRRLFVKIGNSVFTDRHISLDIKDSRIRVQGRIDYQNEVKYPVRLFSPGIMGWYSFIPFMECKHGIVSVNHDLRGGLSINSESYSFDYGKGYIEKDWGSSFPESYLWIQANNFNDHNTSFYFSVAKIPWLGKYFIGFIAFLYYNRKFYLFSTYNKSKISELSHSEDSVFVVMQNNNWMLKISAGKSFSGMLKAPVTGIMNRNIRESIDARLSLALYNTEKKVVYSDSSSRAGMEVIEKIFDYFYKEKSSEIHQDHPIKVTVRI